MNHCDFHYSHLLPKKPGILPLEETMTKKCRRCGAEFVTRSRIRKRCDTCQTVVSAEKQKKANERLKARRAVHVRFMRAFRETIDWMYSDPKAIEAYAKYASISPATAQTVRDRFYPKSMLQLDEVKGMPELMQDAIAFKYIPAALTQAQLDELLQLPKK
jgi:ABC-type nitrate/sulfonate/bicarbonate transport system substrate-binding protein